jgi:hypothetical protein
MIKRNVSFFAFKRRLDHWLLVRAPMLWRTRLPHFLLLLILAVTATIPLFIQTKAMDPNETYGLSVISNWVMLLFCVVLVLMLWVRSIIRKPVGELAPHRHVVTVVAVAIGSYLWLIAPSLLVYLQINAIAQVRLSDQELKTDLAFVSRYNDWECVPSSVWNNAIELKQLRDVSLRYYPYADVKKGPPSRESCGNKEAFSLDPTYVIRACKTAINTIIDARSFEPNMMSWLFDRLHNRSAQDHLGELRDKQNDAGENQFYAIWIGHSWWLLAALATGILTAILSYPRYVWRRIFLQR